MKCLKEYSITLVYTLLLHQFPVVDLTKTCLIFFILWYLIPSHTLQCLSPVEHCAIKGCSARVRKGGKAAHVEQNQSCHYLKCNV